MCAALSVVAPLSTLKPSFAGLRTPAAGEGPSEFPLGQLLGVSAFDGRLNQLVHPLDHVCWLLVARLAAACGECLYSPFAKSDGYAGEVRDHEPQRRSLSGHETNRFRGCDSPGGKINKELPDVLTTSKAWTSLLMRATAASATT